MNYGFDTESVIHGKASLLLYAMYRSRDKSSSLNGLETWERCNSYMRGASLKSSTVAEFIQAFCKKARIGAIKPHHLKTDGLVKIDDYGTLAQAEGIYNYQLDVFEDLKILDIYTNEALYIIMLVRERIQREKELFNNETDY